MDNELIRLKGTGDGVKIQLSSDAAISDIMRALQDKLRAWRKFFGTGHCNMYFTGRKLTKSDELRMETVVRALLPEAAIFYGERRGLSDTVQLPREFVEELKKNEEQSTDQATETAEDTDAAEDDTKQFKAIQEVVTTNFKSNRARLYEGTVKAGRVVESDGHLVLVGDVEEGGTLAANGNVIVLGRLLGSVQAGCMGNAKAYIIAMDMRATDIRIAHVWKKFDNSEDIGGFKKTQLINNDVFIEDFLLKI